MILETPDTIADRMIQTSKEYRIKHTKRSMEIRLHEIANGQQWTPEERIEVLQYLANVIDENITVVMMEGEE